ncbi:MAG: arginine--tRNA ligase [Candidatus Bilamarchaeaceae archaeon]
MKKIIEEAAALIAEATGCSLEEASATTELSKKIGDISSTIAFSIAKRQGRNPADTAKEIVRRMKKSKNFSGVEAVGPYINFYFSDLFYANAIKRMLKDGDKFGKGKQTGKKIMVEYFDANTHKGTHIGHIRNISLGEAICRLLEFSGNKVIRANYQGDIGPHVAKCLWGFINLYHENPPKEHRGVWLGKVYAETSRKAEENQEIEKQIQEINLRLYARDKGIMEVWKRTREWCLEDFAKFYKEFGVRFDEFYFESQTESIGKKISLELLERGIAKIDQGAVIVDLRDENLGVAVLLTKEGYPLYHAKDLGLAKLKFDKYKDLHRSIYVVGKEQELYFKQLFKIFERAGMSRIAEVSYHLVYELVMLPEGKMSSREGTMVLYEDLKRKMLDIVEAEVKKRHADWNEEKVKEIALKVALAAIKFSMVRRESNRAIVFDWDEALSLEGDTGPYLQYAYVRTCGIIRKAGYTHGISKEYVFTEDEKRLIKRMYSFPEIVKSAASSLSPHVLCDYLLDLATELNKFYTTTRVLNAETKEERETRLAIVMCANQTLKNALHLLGIEAPDVM